MDLKNNQKKNTIILNPQNLEILLNKNSELNLYIFVDKTNEETLNYNFNLMENSKLNLNLIYFGSQKNTFNFKTNTNHIESNSTSKISVKSILFDDSKINFTGLINIPKNLNEIDSHLDHHTLLLSDNAEASTTPSLKIESNNVKAGHSATIGKIDEKLIYYIQTRGLTKKQAQEFLIHSFLFKNLNEISDLKIKTKFIKKIETTLSENMINYCKNKTCCITNIQSC